MRKYRPQSRGVVVAVNSDRHAVQQYGNTAITFYEVDFLFLNRLCGYST